MNLWTPFPLQVYTISGHRGSPRGLFSSSTFVPLIWHQEVSGRLGGHSVRLQRYHLENRHI